MEKQIGLRAPLDARAHRHMLPFHRLRIAFPRDMRFGGQLPGIRPPLIGQEAGEAKGFEQGFELPEPVVVAAAKHRGQNLSGLVSEGMPQPAGCLLLAHEAPHFVGLGIFDLSNTDSYLVRL